tara:strand:- start:248 stop:517 length:270 start_codon:yes stop_codon:yes gene_type:complete
MKVKSSGGDSSYYDIPASIRNIQDLVELRNMNFAVGNIFKACFRLGMKEGNTLEYDLNKIVWYAQRELDRISREKITDGPVAHTGFRDS